jgi:2-carboxy-1,4-naphthoquinone phytyltransferase
MDGASLKTFLALPSLPVMTTDSPSPAATVTSPALPSRRKLWLAALKPPMYSVAVVPIWVGTAIAFAATRTLNWPVFLTFLGSAILIIAWLNLSNDVFDADTGIDKHKYHSLVNLTGNQALIFWLANLLLGLGVAGILLISWWQQDLTVLGLVLVCCVLGYTYQGPPFRLGYQGLGEIICFVCFGPLAVSAAYYSQTASLSGMWSGVNGVAATLVGITTSLILFCSHFHQVEDDRAAGKRSPIVRLGTQRGVQWLTWGCASFYLLTLICIPLGLLPVTTLLLFATLPVAIRLVRHVRQHHDQPQQVSNCKFIAVELHFWSGLLLGLSFLPG